MYNMCKNNKVVKYKVINTNIDKKFIGKDLDLQKVKAKGGPTTKPRAKAPAWFVEFRDEQREFNTRIEKQVSNLRSDFDRVIKLNNLKH